MRIRHNPAGYNSRACVGVGKDGKKRDAEAAGQRWVHWRRQLWGTGARAPPLDFQLVILGSLALQTLTKMYKNNAIFAHFLSIFSPFLSFFFAHSFPQGVIIVPNMLERSPINFNSTRTSDSGKRGS